jgi:glutaconate CoA-transferase subunit A
MANSNEKVMDLRRAIEIFVNDGAHISIGGFTINRNPMAAVYEIIRQKKKNLHLYAHSNGQGVDELIGAGCVKNLEIAYGGNGRFAPTCIRFRKAVERGEIRVEDYSNYQMTLRFLAGAMGAPFLPTRSGLETDIVKKWGFSEMLRKKDPRMPDKKLVVVENPFGDGGINSRIVLVPAINPDVTIIHVQKADKRGNVRIEGLTFADVEQAKAAKYVVVTCEELVDENLLRKNPDRNQIPFFCVSAVAKASFGAYPTACYRYYDYDPAYLKIYALSAVNDSLYEKYLEDFVRGFTNHREMLSKIDPEAINRIQANPDTGYAIGLDRK